MAADSGRRGGKWSTLAAMALSSGLTSIPTAAIVLALPTLHRQFDASFDELEWTVNAFCLSYASLLIAAGRLSDLFGRRLFFVTGSVLYGLACLAAATAQSTTWLLIAIAGIGAGAAILTPASLGLITAAFSTTQRGTAIGIWGAAGALTSGVGPALGGILTDQLSWRWIFWIQIPIAVVMVAVTLVSTPESRDPEAVRQIDWGGVLCVAAGMGALTLALVEGSTWEWTSPRVAGLLVGSVVVFAGLGLLERRLRYPLVDFAFFRHRNYTGSNIGLLILNFALASMLFFLPLYLQEYLGYSPLKCGLLLLPASGLMVVGLPLGGPISDRVGPLLPIAAGLGLTAVGMFMLSRITTTSGYGDVWPGMAVAGLGVGLALTPINTGAINAIRKAKSGAAAGILVAVSGIAMVLGVAVSGAVYTEGQEHKVAQQLAEAGLRISSTAQKNLTGLLAGAPSAKRSLATYDAATRVRITHAVHDGFIYGISRAFLVSAVVSLAGVAIAAMLMRRSDVAQEDGVEAPPALTSR
jgi:EmrB/QacA subfamily drug resistance transporter